MDPWSINLVPIEDTNQNIADLLWYRLSSPNSAERWFTTHSIKSLAKYGEWEVIKNLMSKFDCENAGLFQDSKQPFFKLNAQFWLLLTIASIAIEHPDKIISFSEKIMSICRNNLNLHVGIKMASCEAIQNCLANKNDLKSQELKKEIANINPNSEFSNLSVENSKNIEIFENPTPNENLKSEIKKNTDQDLEYYLDYKFRYEVRIFG